MKNLSLFERLRIPDYDNPRQIERGIVVVDREKCQGCKMCVKACPADALGMKENKAYLKSPGVSECMLCGDCYAICPEDAVSLRKDYHYTGHFKTINTGQIKPPRL